MDDKGAFDDRAAAAAASFGGQFSASTGAGGLGTFQALVVQIQNNLLRASLDSVDSEIMQALAMLGANTDCDRAYVFRFENDEVNNTHEWCAPGIAPMIEQLQGVPSALVAPWKAEFDRGLPVHVPDVGAIEAGSALREILEPQGIRSLVAVPMRHEGNSIGFVGFDAVRAMRVFRPEEMLLLQSVADAVAALLMRRQAEQTIAAAQRALAEERAFLRSILDTSLSGFLVFDDQRRVIFANAAASAALGIPEDMLVGRVIAGEIEFSTFDGVPLKVGELPLDIARRTGKPVRDIHVATS
jgi:GAF domain-containing protein